MADKKYQIFVSSTFKDLEKERMAVIEGILRLKHFPAGMELFSASPDEQFEYIKKIIDNCDYYVLIIGGCYGSRCEYTQKSYTEMEFEYALSQNIPILVFPHKNIDDLSKKDDDLTDIKNFTNVAIKNRMCKHWTNTENLKAEVVISLLELFESKPRQGWQRFEDKTELIEENITIRKEKDELIKVNKELKLKLNKNNSDFQDIAGLDELYNIQFKYLSISYTENNSSINTTWNELFLYIAYKLKTPNPIEEFRKSIDSFVISKTVFSIQSIVIEDKIYEQIIMQLQAHKLINLLKRTYGPGYVEEMIELSNIGTKHLMSNCIVKTKKL